MDWLEPTVLWYLATLHVTLALAPITLLLFRGTADQGASVARPVGAVLFIWPVWLLASIGDGLLPFGAATLQAVVTVGGIAAWLFGWRAGAISSPALRALAVAELAFLLAAGAFLGFRGFGPAVVGEEKGSDLMMLASTMRADAMPPQDAWLAGETINYYYIGYVIWAAFARLVRTVPVETYNLAMATAFGMTVVGVMGVARNVVAPIVSARAAWLAGGLAALFVVGIGNPWAFRTFLARPAEEWNAAELLGRDKVFREGLSWQATRTIFDDARHDPITEFPAFAFMLSDLHPHLIAFPFTVAALMGAWALATTCPCPCSTGVRTSLALLARVAVTGVLVGALYGMNSWDFPTYLGLGLLALAVGTRHRPWVQRVAALGVFGLVAIVAWLPFHLAFVGPTQPADHLVARIVAHVPVVGDALASVALHDADRTSIAEYLDLFGFTYVVALALIVTVTWRRRSLFEARRVRVGSALLTGVLVLVAVVLPAPLVAMLGVPLLAIGLCVVHDRRVSPVNAALGLFGVAFVLTLGPEFVYVRDFFDARMNTVFKVFFQVWLLMGIGAGIAVMLLWSAVRRHLLWRVALVGGTTAILLAGLTYPVVAGKQWLDWRSPEREWVGIDGLAYLDVPTRPGEYAALQWLWKNAKPDDVMLSAGGCEFSTLVGRPASVTGIPTILGWPNHEVQWHLAPGDDRDNISERVEHINRLFEAPDPALIERYGISLIYVGNIELNGAERGPAKDCAPGPFANATNPEYPGPGWSMVFAEGNVRIYRRDGT